MIKVLFICHAVLMLRGFICSNIYSFGSVSLVIFCLELSGYMWFRANIHIPKGKDRKNGGREYEHIRNEKQPRAWILQHNHCP